MFFEPHKRDKSVLRFDPFKALIAPRPIGWVSTLSPEGKANLAPYSYFNAFSQSPHYVAFGSGPVKDSMRNIETTGENAYRIEIAVAGFTPDELNIEVKENLLTVTGRKTANDDATQKTYLHRGLAERDFERRFQLADYVVVTEANLVNGLLSIALKRELPEALKPRRIEIGAGTPLIEGKVKADKKAA